MKLFSKITIVISSLFLLSACNTTDQNALFSKKDAGALAGAIGGAWVGSNLGKGKGNIAAIAAGTLLGTYLGSEVGASLDRADIAYHNRTAQKALEHNKTGQISTWQNPDSGVSGAITPTKTYHSNNTYCREYTQKINIGSRQEEAYGTACRQPDGSWQIKQSDMI